MKRFAFSVLSATNVPLLVLFALTAAPARLYAEAAPPPPECSAPEVEACTGKSTGDSCSLDGGAGRCGSSLCESDDAGRNVDSLVCFPSPEIDAGPDGGPDADSGSNGRLDSGLDDDATSEPGWDGSFWCCDATTYDGPYDPSDAQPAPTPEAGSDSGEEPGHGVVVTPAQSSGCSAAGGPSGNASASAAALLLAVGALLAMRRRAAPRETIASGRGEGRR